MESKKDIHKELEELAPFLSKLNKKEDFVIPENYFENLQNDVLAKVQEEKFTSSKASEKKRSGLFLYLLRPKYVAGIAAMVLLTLTCYLLFYTTENQSVISALDEISNEEISTYISANIDEFEEELFYDIDNNDIINFFPEELNTSELDQLLDEIIDDIDIETLEKLL